MLGLTLVSVPPIRVEPLAEPQSPNPSEALILKSYQQLPFEQFFIPKDYDTTFLSPTALNCGICQRQAIQPSRPRSYFRFQRNNVCGDGKQWNLLPPR
jgi:hypothetical protein